MHPVPSPRNPLSRSGGALAVAVATIVLLVVITAIWACFAWPRRNAVVVYCTHDIEYSRPVLERFERETGIRLNVIYDTESTKAVGFENQLIKEKDAPRCDVFWNNQLLGTLELKERGVLRPYRGRGWERAPAAFRDPEGYWVGLGARLRVLIVNTERVPEPSREAVEALLASDDLSMVAIAKPTAGTTLTHYSALWQELGPEGLAAWHDDTRRRGIREVGGNADTKDAVASGACAVGYTDTDDAFAALDAGAPVVLLPVRLPSGKVVAMPNTVALIAGRERREDAEKLVDFLASAAVEEALAQSARQVPVGPVDQQRLPPEVRDLAAEAGGGIELRTLLPARRALRAWLAERYE